MVKARPGSMKGKMKQTAGGRRRAKRVSHALSGRMPAGRICAPDEVKSAWNATQTRNQNLRRLGLAADVNDIYASGADIGNTGINVDVVSLLQMRAARGEKKAAKRASPGEIGFVVKAVAKYGYDYRKIQRDLKLNYFQWNVPQIERKIRLVAGLGHVESPPEE